MTGRQKTEFAMDINVLGKTAVQRWTMRTEMKIKRRVCDMCKKTLPMRYGCSTQRYKVKVRLLDKYADWGDEDMPTIAKVDLCPNCMRNLCEGVLLLNRKEENDD